MDENLTSTEVCRVAGITYRSLDYWTRRGLAFPDVGAAGCGSQRRWSRAEAEVLKRMATWRSAGVALGLAREMAERGARIVYDDVPLLQPTAA